MNLEKKNKIFDQYIYQYDDTIDKTLFVLRKNKQMLHVPYAQFLFSIIDYYGLLFSTAADKFIKKTEKNNFINFFSSEYFPSEVRCKSTFLYFVRNGVIHQIFPKAMGLNICEENKLFIKDSKIENLAVLNLEFLDKITCEAISKFKKDLTVNDIYIENMYKYLFEINYGLNDHGELEREINNCFDGDFNKIFENCY
jgi:hypothetical protein